jgi:hypothetical protein
MSAASEAVPLAKPNPYRAVLWGGLAVGVLDITYACVSAAIRAGIGPVRIFQSVASGLLGNAAFEGGAPTAALGLALHFFIAFTWAAVYVAASRKLRFMVERAVPAGLLYGVIVYAFMNAVVIPLSAAPFKISYTPLKLAIDVAGHMLLVGLPIALAARRFSK